MIRSSLLMLILLSAACKTRDNNESEAKGNERNDKTVLEIRNRYRASLGKSFTGQDNIRWKCTLHNAYKDSKATETFTFLFRKIDNSTLEVEEEAGTGHVAHVFRLTQGPASWKNKSGKMNARFPDNKEIILEQIDSMKDGTHYDQAISDQNFFATFYFQCRPL